MSAAFDCVGHSIFIQRLKSTVGLSDVVLDWIKSFLSDRTQQTSYNGQLSAMLEVLCGVPQGSVLGPLLYILYTADLAHIVASHSLSLHQYADDCQVYMSVPVWRLPSCSPSALNMPSGCWGLADSQSSPFVSGKNTGHVAWLCHDIVLVIYFLAHHSVSNNFTKWREWEELACGPLCPTVCSHLCTDWRPGKLRSLESSTC